MEDMGQQTGIPNDRRLWTRRDLFRVWMAAGVVAAGGGGFLLGACAGGAPAAPTPSTKAPAATSPQAPAPTPTAKKGGTLVAGWEEDASTLDPAKMVCAHELRMAGQFLDTLWTLFGDTTDIKPALAEKWTFSPDGLVWDVTLRPNLKFQDGTPVNADAVKWSFDRWLDPKHPFHDPPYGMLGYFYASLGKVDKTGDLSVRLTLKEKDAAYVSKAVFPYAAVVSPTAVQKAGNKDFGVKPVGTGTFQVASWEKGVRIVLKRNDGYWGQKPALDEVIIKPIVENAQRLSQLQAGQVDLIVAMSPEFVPTIKADPKLQLLEAPGMHIWWIALNMHEEPLKKKEVRQALNYAVNKEAIVKDVLHGVAVVTPGPLIANSWGNDPSIKPYPYDPKKAKDLLTAAGYPNGFTTKFWVPESGSGMIAPKEIGQVVQANLKEVGVNVEVVTQEWTSYTADWGKIGFDKGGKPLYGMAEMSWNFPAPDPGLWLDPNLLTSSQPPNAFNGGYYSNPQVDDLLTKANSTPDQEVRAGHYKQVQKLLMDDCPWIFMFSANNIAAATKRLKGVVLNPNPWLLRLETAYFEG